MKTKNGFLMKHRVYAVGYVCACLWTYRGR